MKTGGTAKFITESAKQAYLNWYANLQVTDLDSIFERIRKTQPRIAYTAIRRCADMMFQLYGGHRVPYSNEDIERWEEQRAKFLQTIKDFLYMSENFLVPIKVGEWHEGNFAYLYLGNPEKGIIVPDPEECLEYIPDMEYGDLSPAQVRSALMLGNSAAHMEILPVDANMLTPNMVKCKLTEQKENLQKAQKELDDVRNCRSPELVKLQEEIARKQAELQALKDAAMAELQAKIDELNQQKEDFENQIYLLESQIYNILCFAGETVKFAKVKSGANAPNDTPIVIYQKLHFLDEDMGRLASIYDIQWSDISLFEQFLAASPVAQDTFIPNERCISLVRLSKDNTTIAVDDSLPYQNILTRYEYYHGTTVGILIRNGDNIYVGWTDESRIHIQDDLIVGKVVTEVTPATQPRSQFDIACEEKQKKEQKKKILDGLISRSFVYNILQGVVEHTPILPLPAGVKLNKQSAYVMYSMADGWITDNRFGSFTQILERCKTKICKGDMILTVQHLVPEHKNSNFSYSRSWDNVRGRGEMNRTHDVSATDCTLYPVNLVEYDEPVQITEYRFPDALNKEEWLYGTTTEPQYLSDRCEIIRTFDRVTRHVFISLKKQYSWDGEARANFEIFEGEYIPLTYLNSVWLEWAITNKSLGGWKVKDVVVNYAYAIKYLKTALDFVRKREKEEKRLLDEIDPEICKSFEWQVRLSEWKLEKGVRELTAYQAKRFAKVFFAKEN